MIGPASNGSGPDSPRPLPNAAAKVRRAWLTLRVHGDAIRSDPLVYLRATLWRMRGLRVRSRNSIAPLIGRSPRAYALWISRNEPAAPARQFDADGPEVIPVIDCSGARGELADTLESLNGRAWHAMPVTIGGPDIAGVTRINDPRELAQFSGPSGAWFCPIEAGDCLAPGAMSIYGGAAAATKAALIYADDDLLEGGLRSKPHFKPQWNPDLFDHHDYITGAAAVFATRETLLSLPKRRWAEALVAAALPARGALVHVPLVLHHRIKRPLPARPAKPGAALVAPVPLVSAIIPTRNQFGLLRSCIEGLERCDYPRVETIIIDNDSDDPATIDYLLALERRGVTILHMPGPFNYSRLNNAAGARARGDYLCFLNNDVEMVESDWLSLLVRQAMRPDVGAVGARLLYPDRTVQHAGVFLGIGGGAGHGHRFQAEDDSGYFDRARLPQQVSAVTAACMVVARDKFLAVAGFDELDFPVAFNDVDLCLKLNARGWQSLYEPRAMLIHHESKSRGSDAAKSNRVRFAGELAALKRKWHTDNRPDPYHHPHLSPFSEQFLIAV